MKTQRINVEVSYVKSAAALDGDPGWRVRVQDHSKATNYFRFQKFAIPFGRERCLQLVADGKLAELVVKSKIGNRIRYRNTYPRSSDPRRHLH